MWHLHRPGIRVVSPALQGGLLTLGHRGSLLCVYVLDSFCCQVFKFACLSSAVCCDISQWPYPAIRDAGEHCLFVFGPRIQVPSRKLKFLFLGALLIAQLVKNPPANAIFFLLQKKDWLLGDTSLRGYMCLH